MAGMVVEVKADDRRERVSKATAAIADDSKGSSDRYGLGAVNHVDGLYKPSIKLQAPRSGASRDLSLTLVLQTPDHRPQKAIQERVGEEGLISITFE